ncbi:MAG: endonuclease/exonuclease/phosphatase family protein [Planctomycetota bacterium]|nr:endonuclease/exonuclease/phosphatase family protein [Planctomycetota bacterium]
MNTSHHADDAVAPAAWAKPTLIVRVFWDLCWIAIAMGTVVAVLRLIVYDQHFLLVCANSLAAYLYAPALLLLPLAVLRRRKILACVSLFLVVCHAVWIWPDYLPLLFGTSRHVERQEAAGLKIFSANLYSRSVHHEAMLNEINAADPDLVLLQEYSAGWRAALSDEDFRRRYPHRVGLAREDAFGIAIYSKQPFVDQSLWISGQVPQAEVVIQHGGRKIRVINWHPLPPRNVEYHAVWQQQYDQLFEKLATLDTPTLIVGDFNATQHARQMRRFAQHGYRSAHEVTGRGYAVTWPNGTAWIPPMRLDQAMMSRRFECVTIREGVGQGSDHKPLIAEFVMVGDEN